MNANKVSQNIFTKIKYKGSLRDKYKYYKIFPGIKYKGSLRN